MAKNLQALSLYEEYCREYSRIVMPQSCVVVKTIPVLTAYNEYADFMNNEDRVEDLKRQAEIDADEEYMADVRSEFEGYSQGRW